MNILFCSEPFQQKNIDPDWEEEYRVSQQAQNNSYFFDYDDFKQTRQLKIYHAPDSKELMIYRGWMMPVEMYKDLYDQLLTNNLQLINSPEQYQHCYYLPDSYHHIKQHTPMSVFTDDSKLPNDTDLQSLLKDFADKPIIVKDYVKSQKHYWSEACFIPDASNLVHVKKVVSTFIDKQGDGFQGGLVFREFVKLKSVGTHPQSQMPLTEEYRIFILNKKPISCCQYWRTGNYQQSELLNLEQFESVFDAINSNFFTMDIAKTQTGEWIVIELGDGQVAEYLSEQGLESFYSNFKLKIWSKYVI
jgi:hypothetical protein